MIRVLVSGFEPIWGIKKTPSGELAKLWAQGALAVDDVGVKVEVKGLVLPQQFGVCTEQLCAEIVSFRPHIILMYGATQRNDPIRLERFAINVEYSPMGDNTRIPVQERPVVRFGPPAYEATLDTQHLVERLNEQGVDAKTSFHAGTHTCNSIMYGVLHWLANNDLGHGVVAGFIHVPFPNDFGVVEDELWTTATFSGIVHSSVTLVREAAKLYLGE